MVRFCKNEKCRWYSDPTKYGRKCYYEPQCWRGWLDEVIELMELRREK